ncbi:MAG: PKD domain-containing protein [Methanoregula sp.]
MNNLVSVIPRLQLWWSIVFQKKLVYLLLAALFFGTLLVIPVVADQFTFQGHVYEGLAGDTSRPVGNVKVMVFGSSSPDSYNPSVFGAQGASGTTNANGYFSLPVSYTPTDPEFGYFPYYHLVIFAPKGYSVVSTSPLHGTTLTRGWTVHAYPVPAGAGGDFWVVPSVPPHADFLLSNVSGPAPLPVTITDTSSGYPTSWSWTFTGPISAGSGPISQHYLPTYILGEPGTVTVTLTVANAYGSNSVTKRVTVSRPISQIHADFTASPTDGPVSLAVRFMDASTGNPTQWSWDFNNDGVFDSSARNPDHTYTRSGTYSVRLVVYDRSGKSDTLVKTSLITVRGTPTLPPTTVSPPIPTPTPSPCTFLFLPCDWIIPLVIIGVLIFGAYVIGRGSGGRNKGPGKAPPKQTKGTGSYTHPYPKAEPRIDIEVQRGIEMTGMDYPDSSIRLETEAGIEFPEETGGKGG